MIRTLLLFSLALGYFPACAGPSVQTKIDVVRADITRARKQGAYDCAPNELAMSESHSEFSETELGHGNIVAANKHLSIAQENVKAALKKTKGCGSTRVTVNGRIDEDGDGIADIDDKCPGRAEDFDKFQDADGCPDADNDGDKVLDPLDACPLAPEDIDGFHDGDGCPDNDNDEDGLPDADDACPNSRGTKENRGCPLNDQDGDGVPDESDKCPDQPEDFDMDRDDDGCPDKDTDADGLADEIDKCPSAPEDVDGFQDDDGCPDTDNDGDGVLDVADKCPRVSGTLDGCPDRDGDGVYDRDDACPEIPGGAGTKGCPQKDSDADGILDHLDACPSEVGMLQPQSPKRNGCPKAYSLIILHDDHIEIRQQVNFDTGTAKIRGESHALLGEVADAIRSSNIENVHIEGYTDSRGDDESNLQLSQDRADAVRRYLIEKEDLDEEHLDAKGFGESKPLESNKTARGRSATRRVEFKVERKN